MVAALAKIFDVKTLFGSANDRQVEKYRKKVAAINALEAGLQKLSDAELQAKTQIFRDKLANGQSENDILVEAFATVREAARRVLDMRHFDVQLIGGLALHMGKIAEMRTGEGKTLVGTLAVYLSALSGKGAHVVTVNDYLARRDAEWMGKLYHFLGLTVGVIVPGMDDPARKQAYDCDITYGTNNEFGFDYLRDNLKFTLDTMVQRDFHFALVDEVDSILIDEARTPLIISGPAEDSSQLYLTINKLIPALVDTHYEMDEKQKTITLTETGTEFVEKLMKEKTDLLKSGDLYDIDNITLLHYVNQALRAHKLFTRDVDYIVKDNKVIIIDEFTGRMMEGRRYGEGLHQALEAREGVQVQQENQTLAAITFQNYFRMYPKLAGMTGTAMTEAGEFEEIYNLQVVDIPTNQTVIRRDNDDEVYRTSDERDQAVIDQIVACNKKGQPVLVGTVSIEKSEALSRKLKKAKIKHNVLNARQHESEAYIIGEAGTVGAVTIATNMAGRGTDIQLGGNLELRLGKAGDVQQNPQDFDEKSSQIIADCAQNKAAVLAAGGLYVIGTERHESRRIDNQLRGRSGRQGDPGESKFYVSLQDDLMRIFGSERIDGMLKKLGLEVGEAIAHPWVNKALEKAQTKVEARNFDIRKQLLKFDDVMNDQRKVIFEQRKDLMRTEDVSDTINDMRAEVLDTMINRHIPPKALANEWELDGLHEEVMRLFGLNLPVHAWAEEDGIAEREIRARLETQIHQKMAQKEARYGAQLMRVAERNILLQILDNGWKDHLLQLDHLRQGIGLRAYAQRDPLNEYKTEAFSQFEDLLSRLRFQVVQLLAHVEFRTGNEVEAGSGPSDAQGYVPGDAPSDAQGDALGYAPKNQAPALPRRDIPSVAPLSPATALPTYTAETAPPGYIFHDQLQRYILPSDPATWGKVPRNAPCPCGSGKKYKHCHGRL